MLKFITDIGVYVLTYLCVCALYVCVCGCV